jgi:hypothetical protein
LSNNIERDDDCRKFVESKLENEVFEKDFKQGKYALKPKPFEHLKKDEVQSLLFY